MVGRICSIGKRAANRRPKTPDDVVGHVVAHHHPPGVGTVVEAPERHRQQPQPLGRHGAARVPGGVRQLLGSERGDAGVEAVALGGGRRSTVGRRRSTSAAGVGRTWPYRSGRSGRGGPSGPGYGNAGGVSAGAESARPEDSPGTAESGLTARPDVIHTSALTTAITTTTTVARLPHPGGTAANLRVAVGAGHRPRAQHHDDDHLGEREDPLQQTQRHRAPPRDTRSRPGPRWRRQWAGTTRGRAWTSTATGLVKARHRRSPRQCRTSSSAPTGSATNAARLA